MSSNGLKEVDFMGHAYALVEHTITRGKARVFKDSERKYALLELASTL